MAAKTMDFFRERDVMIFLSSARSPTIPEWDEYTAAIRALATPTSPLRGLLVVSEGGGPDARQRSEVVEAFGDHAVPVAMCSASAMERGIITAMRWIYRAKIASFAFDEVERGLAHLGVDESRRMGLYEWIRGTQRRLGWRVVGKEGLTASVAAEARRRL